MFRIGSTFPGKIACVQIFTNAIKAKDIPQVMYQCYDGQAGMLMANMIVFDG